VSVALLQTEVNCAVQSRSRFTGNGNWTDKVRAPLAQSLPQSKIVER